MLGMGVVVCLPMPAAMPSVMCVAHVCLCFLLCAYMCANVMCWGICAMSWMFCYSFASVFLLSNDSAVLIGRLPIIVVQLQSKMCHKGGSSGVCVCVCL